MIDFQERLQAHYDKVVENFGTKRVFAVVTVGSMNYGLATEESDCDTKALIFPSIEQLAVNDKPTSLEFMVDGEICLVRDFRLMFQSILKANPNFIEIMYSAYKIVTPEYQVFWDKLINMRNEIINSMPRQVVNAACGVAKQKYEKFKDSVSFGTYNSKELMHFIRMEVYLEYFMQAHTLDKSIRLTVADSIWLKNVRNFILSPVEAVEKAKQVNARIQYLKQQSDKLHIEPAQRCQEFNYLAIDMLNAYLRRVTW